MRRVDISKARIGGAPSFFGLKVTTHFNNPNASCGSYGTAAAPCNNASFGQVTSTNNLVRDGIDQRQFEISMRLSF